MNYNGLLARTKRPESGWDPITFDYGHAYAEAEWAKGADPSLLDDLNHWMGGLDGKRVLDLGGGPGHYSVALAERGADVTWYDISAVYRAIARGHATAAGVAIDFRLGYMDEAPLHVRSFDLVFNRICWYYGFDDRSFADVIHRLLAPGGSAYVDVNPAGVFAQSRRAGIRTALNTRLGIKIGYPSPPHGRVERLFRAHRPARLLADYRSTRNDRVWYQRQGETVTK